MSAPLIFLDRDGDLNPQNQLRQKLVDAILGGSLPLGRRLPSSRQLALQLDVARTTVVLAYQQLSAEGYLTRPPTYLRRLRKFECAVGSHC